MEKPDAVIIDLDGTLLNAQRQCSPRNRRVLARCLQHGIPVVIATSRSPRSIRQLLGAAFLHQYSHVVLNGALAWAVSPWQGRYQRPLATTVALHIVDTVLTRHASVFNAVELDGDRLATNVPMDAPTLWQHFLATPDLVTPFTALRRHCVGAGKRPVKLGRSAHAVAGGAATLARLCRRREGRPLSWAPSAHAVAGGAATFTLAEGHMPTLRRLVYLYRVDFTVLLVVTLWGVSVPLGGSPGRAAPTEETCGRGEAVNEPRGPVTAWSVTTTARRKGDSIML